MPEHAARFHVRWTLASVLLLAGLGGCMKWSTMKLDKPLSVALQDKPMKRMRVTTLRDGAFEMKEPYVHGDSLYGYADVEARRVRPDGLCAIPLAEVTRVDRRTVNGTAVALGLLGAGTAVAIIASATSSDPPPPPCRRNNSCLVSCPLVYSWNGERWRLDSGTFGGAIFPSLSRTDVDNLEFAREENGVLRLRLANELQETDHVDGLSLLAVDHEPDVTYAPDGNGRLHRIGSFAPPTEAVDDDGRDVRDRILLADGRAWESPDRPRDAADPEELRDGINLTFRRPPGTPAARLIVDANNTPWAASLLREYVRRHGSTTSAWYDSLSSDPARARRLGATLAGQAFLRVSLLRAGGWSPAGLIWEAGPEIRKRQVLALDLTDVEGDVVHVRLESIPALWRIDRVAIDMTPISPDAEVRVHQLALASAVDQNGADVRPLLAAIDGREYVMETGDYAELQVKAPPLPEGMERTYLLKTTGWYRIHAPDAGEPQSALLSRVENEPDGMSRVAVELLNESRIALAAGGSAASRP